MDLEGNPDFVKLAEAYGIKALRITRPVFFFKQKTAYEVAMSDWSSDVCSSDLLFEHGVKMLVVTLALNDKMLSKYTFFLESDRKSVV